MAGQVKHPFTEVNAGYVSVQNSTIVNVSNGATYTGDWEEVSEYAIGTFLIYSDQTVTLHIDASPDSTATTGNLTRTESVIVTGAATPQAHTFSIFSKYVRARIVNASGSDTTEISLQTRFHKAEAGIVSSNVSDTILNTDPVDVVRLASDYDLDVARGLVTGHATARKFGANGTVGSTEEVIWSTSSAYAGFLSTAIAVRVKAGGDVADTAAGAGAREITVSGLDETFTEASETLATAGTSASAATTTTFIRVNRLFVSSSGTYSASGLNGANVAAIEVETTTPTTVAMIPIQDGQTTISVYTVPAGKTLYVKDIVIGTSGSKPATVKMFQRLNSDDISVPVQGRRLVANFGELDGHVNIPYRFALSFPEKTDIWFTGEVASTSSQVHVEWYSVLVTN